MERIVGWFTSIDERAQSGIVQHALQATELRKHNGPMHASCNATPIKRNRLSYVRRSLLKMSL
jgi:hypothetical protein